MKQASLFSGLSGPETASTPTPAPAPAVAPVESKAVAVAPAGPIYATATPGAKPKFLFSFKLLACAMTPSPDGQHIWIAGTAISVVDMAGNTVMKIGGKQFQGLAWGVAFDTNGEVFCCDTKGQIHVFRQDGTHVRSFGSPGKGEGALDFPEGVAVDGKGQLFVTGVCVLISFGISLWSSCRTFR